MKRFTCRSDGASSPNGVGGKCALPAGRIVGKSDLMRGSHSSGSMPILSLTADRIRCLQPGYRSVRLNRDMPEEELDLFEFPTRRVTEPGTCPLKIVRREPLDGRFAGLFANDAPDRFFRQTISPSLPVLVNSPK